MNNRKSKELYAKMVYQAIGNIDDDLIIEAREQNRTSMESRTFQFQKFAAFAAALVLVVGASFFGIHAIVQMVSSGADGNIAIASSSVIPDIRASFRETGEEDDHVLMFSDCGEITQFYFTFTGYRDEGMTVTYGGNILPAIRVGDVIYYQVDLSTASKKQGTVTLHLRSVEDIEALENSDIRIRYDLRDPGATTHPSIES